MIVKWKLVSRFFSLFIVWKQKVKRVDMGADEKVPAVQELCSRYWTMKIQRCLLIAWSFNEQTRLF